MRLSLLLALLALPLAANTYFLTDPFTSLTANWTVNGTLTASSPNGLSSTAASGGSVILAGNVVNPTTGETNIVYELKATLRIQASGGTFVLYSHATANALAASGNTGTFYSVDLSPTLTSNGCTMSAYFYKSIAGTVTALGSRTLACKDQMTVRWTQRNGYYSLYTSLNEFLVLGDGSIASGKPGFGVRNMPNLSSTNGIVVGELGHLEYVAPGTIDPSSFRTAAFDNRIDLAWTGVVDNTGGSGLVLYQVHRLPGPPSGGSYMGNARGAYFSDSTVSPNTTYTYTIYPHDAHLNLSTRAVTVTTPAANVKDPRKVGVRPLGTYWGASPENIDLQSGNLSFSLPTVTAQGRGGTAVPFRLSYNSQNWRKDPAKAWLLGTDVGFGFGWKMLAGALTPVYSDWFTIHHFVYTDATGAEYDLYVNNGGIWRSKTGLFVEYDASERRLYFPGGSYWEFDCTANGTEADAGTLYPTRPVDTNGNEIKLAYQGGLRYGGVNGSARVTEVEDVRAKLVSGSKYRSYLFTYNADAIPHLTSIVSEVGDGASYTLSYTAGHALSDPFAGASFGTAARLNSMMVPGSGGLQFSMEYQAGSQELKKVTMPLGGTLEWVYGAKTLGWSRTQMEVTQRILNSNDGAGNRTYTMERDDAGDTSRLAHSYTRVIDASATSDKLYTFTTTAGTTLGLLAELRERTVAGGVATGTVRRTVPTWGTTAVSANPYIAASVETIDVDNATVAKSSKSEQEVDQFGNLTWKKQYDYYAPGGTPPLARTYTYTYETAVGYANQRIRNRVKTVKLQKPGGSVLTLVTNTYDVYPFGVAPAVAFPALLRQHDTANYGTALIYRGNVTSSVSFSKTVNITYDYTENALTSNDSYGHTAGRVMDENRNYAVPKTMSGGSLQTSMTWNTYNAPLTATGPNTDTTSFSYDAYARPASRTEANGAVTTLTYSTAPHFTLATTGTRWTKSYPDGFGRTIKVESGYNSSGTAVTVSVVKTEYAPCACTPVGKLWRTSLPYAPGGTVYWTENVYDAIGRTLQVKQPVIPGYAGSAGVTNYTYAGNTVTTTDPAGKWKRMESDALGNLRFVYEPRPGGGADYVSQYVYSELGQLLTVTMARPGKGTGNAATVTQTRTWAYNGGTQRLDSVTHPESGTTSYLYNLDGSVQRKTDAKGQYVEFAYDSEGRVTSARRYAPGGFEDACARVDYHYGSQSFDATFTANAAGRLAATATGVQTGGCQNIGAGQLIEMYSYTAAGAVTKKRMRIIRSGTTVDKDVTYTYGTDGKLATVLYPGASVPFTYSYNLMDQPVKMTGAPTFLGGTTVDLVKGVEYGVAGQVKTMQYMQWQDSGTPYYFTETRTYNELFQLKQQVTAGSVTAANIEYTYSNTGANNGRITSRKNNERSGEQGSYTYDSLSRVTAASSTTGWTQSFDYDGFGNLWSQTMAGGSATPMSVNLDMLKNRINTAGWNYDNNGNTVAMPTSGGYAALEYDVDNRLTKWTGPAGEENYRYLPDNKRVWKKAPGGAETVYFYGVGGQKLITYTLQTSPVALLFQSENVYFAGKLIRANGVSVVHDRLGSVVARGDSSSSVITKHDYLPYGEEMGTATGGNVDKFGTYLRDQTTGLDHADQRYFAGTLGGRFLSSDPYEASGGAGEPGSWNRFAYVGGDPVNFNDRSGLTKCRIAGYNGQQAQVFCASTVDPGVWGWGWVDAPGGSGLPLDENGEWARGVTDRAATSAWGSNLDRMAAGRNQTTAQYRPAAIRAISGLHENCRRLFDSRIVSTGGTILAALSNAADSSMFYDSNGAEGQMTFTQATGLSVMGGAQGPAEDPYILVSLLEPTHRAITLTFGGNALPHIVLSNGFSQLSADQQSAILIHELLHVVLGDHLPIINALGIPNDYIVTHFGNESFAITECVLNGCPK